MDEFRSKSTGDGRMQLDYYYYGNGPNPSYDLHNYSVGTPQRQQPSYMPSYDFKLKRSKTSGSSSSSSKIWCFNDPEFQRKKRVASYRVYGAEGKVKGSFRKSFKWLKDRYFRLFHGEW